MPARRARAARRPSRSANFDAPSGRGGMSMTRRSTVRPDRSDPAIARPSSGAAGVSTTSHSSCIPRATASTGSKASGEIQPGHDGPVPLRLRGEPERDRRPPARQVAPQREAHPTGQTARPEDGVEGRKSRWSRCARGRRRGPGSVRHPGPVTGPAGGPARAPARRSSRVQRSADRPRRHRRHRHPRFRRRAGRPLPSAIGGSRGPPSRPWRGSPSGAQYRTSVRMNQWAIRAIGGRCGRSRDRFGPAGVAGPAGTSCYTLAPSSRSACCDAPVGM